MLVVPVATPYTIPLETPTVPVARLLLTHVPPVGAPVSDVVPPTHVDAEPEMDGNALTTSALVRAVDIPHTGAIAVNVYAVLSVVWVAVMLAVPVIEVGLTIVLVPPVQAYPVTP